MWLLINPSDGSLYGIVIATAPEARKGYLIPACKVFDNIESRLPTSATVGFPASDVTNPLPDRGRLTKLQQPPRRLGLRVEWRAGESLAPQNDESLYQRPPLPSPRPTPQPSHQGRAQILPKGTPLPSQDPYAVPGVDKDAELMIIRINHRKLLLKCHPDKIKDEAERAKSIDEFIRVQQAYEILSGPARRAWYDDQVKVTQT